VERVPKTILKECWQPPFTRQLISKYPELRLDLSRHLRYRPGRAHTGRRPRSQVIGRRCAGGDPDPSGTAFNRSTG
jgi:hypothetical protein